MFVMGAPETEEDSSDSERPQHEVTVSTFFMGRYPITQTQWRAIASRTDLKVGRDLNPNPAYFKDRQDSARRPVECVSWYDALEFCARLSRHTGKDYRLPSESEWEYACRAIQNESASIENPSYPPFHFGETISTELANYKGADEKYGAYGRGLRGEYRQETTDVDYFKVANPFGLSDMHGNVWEWCLDPWHDNYKGAPTDGRVWDEQNKNGNLYQNILKNIDVLLQDTRVHVIRGGSWCSDPRNCRSACRSRNYPGIGVDDYCFRVFCGLPRTF